MNLSPMRYKDYIWPHNPKVYGISFERKVAVKKIPFGNYHMQDMGLSYRVLKGEGEFAGRGAYTEFKKLATIFYRGEPGILIHPVWQASSAYLVKLSLLQEPKEDYVKYSFEFWEDYDGYRPTTTLTKEVVESVSESSHASRNTYSVIPGETMWAIAERYNLPLTTLIEKNPQIKNPNLIYPGDILYIS